MEYYDLPLNIQLDPRIKTVVLPSYGDGSCLVHSILMAVCLRYRDAVVQKNHQTRVEMARKLRNDMADILANTNPNGKGTYYETIANGAYPSFAEHNPEFELKAIQAHLRSNEQMWEWSVGIIEEVLNIQVYIIDESSRKIYQRPGLPKHLPSVVIWSTPGHFQTIGCMNKDRPENGVTLYFAPEHEFIQCLVFHLMSNKKV